MSRQTRQFGSRWFRVYDEAADDPKLLMLSDKLHRFLFTCWCLASKHEGYLPAIPEIACRTRKTEAAVAGMVAELRERGLLEREGNTFTPHNWGSRQYKSDVSTERVKAFRERQRSADETFPKQGVTVPETPSEQNRAEQSRYRAEQTCGVSRQLLQNRVVELPTPGTQESDDQFEITWKRWPRQTGKDEAARDWVSVVGPKNVAAVVACADRYLASDEVSRGAVMNLGSTSERVGWLIKCARDKWESNWPQAREAPAKLSIAEQAKLENKRRMEMVK